MSITLGINSSNGDYREAAGSVALGGVTMKLWLGGTFTKVTQSSGAVYYNFMPKIWYSLGGTATVNFTFAVKDVTCKWGGGSFSYTGPLNYKVTAGTTYSEGTKYLLARGSTTTISSQAYGREYNSTVSGSLKAATYYTSGTPYYYDKTLTNVTTTFQNLQRTYLFKANGGRGSDISRSGYYGASITSPASNAFTPPGSTSGTQSATVTFNFHDGVTSPRSESFTISTRTDYYLNTSKSWNRSTAGTGSVLKVNTSAALEGNYTFYAIWSSSTSIAGGQRVNLPEVGPRTGYEFEGWYHGSTYQGKSGPSNSVFTSSATIDAKWTAKSYGYTVYYKGPNGEDLFSPITGTAKYDTKVEVKAKTKNGYVATASSYSLLITDIEEQNQYIFTYKYQANKLTYSLGAYGTWEGVEPQPLTSYNISYGTVSPIDGKTYITLAVPNIKTGYEDYSFIGWTGGGPNTPTISTPTAEVKIDVNQVTYNGKTANYVANYDRISKRWKSGNIWRPIMNTYVKNADGTWHLVPKGKSWVKTKSGWVTEKTDD